MVVIGRDVGLSLGLLFLMGDQWKELFRNK